MSTPRSLTHEFAGAEWIRECLHVEPSPLGTVVADILGFVYRGIYHIPQKSLQKVDWTCTYAIQVTTHTELATYDGSELTHLVVLAHDLAIRVSVQSLAPGYLRLHFHGRDRESEHLSVHHPTIEKAIERVRKLYTVQYGATA